MWISPYLWLSIVVGGTSPTLAGSPSLVTTLAVSTVDGRVTEGLELEDSVDKAEVWFNDKAISRYRCSLYQSFLRHWVHGHEE